MKIGVVDYRAGNLKSIENALRYLAKEINITYTITSDPKKLLESDKMIFPGVGEASSAMKNLRELSLIPVITEYFKTGKSILGICLGTQIILDSSEENSTECLGLVPGKSKLFPGNMKLKIPQIGWNNVVFQRDLPIFKGIKSGSYFYFVHSFYPAPDSKDYEIAVTDYGIQFSSGIKFKNLTAFQFHPEKSGEQGLRLLKNFLQEDY